MESVLLKIGTWNVTFCTVYVFLLLVGFVGILARKCSFADIAGHGFPVCKMDQLLVPVSAESLTYSRA